MTMFTTLYNISRYVAGSAPVFAIIGLATGLSGSARVGAGLFWCGVSAFLLGFGGIMSCGVWAIGFSRLGERPVYSTLYRTFYSIFSAFLVLAGLGVLAEVIWHTFSR